MPEGDAGPVGGPDRVRGCRGGHIRSETSPEDLKQRMHLVHSRSRWLGVEGRLVQDRAAGGPRQPVAEVQGRKVLVLTEGWVMEITRNDVFAVSSGTRPDRTWVRLDGKPGRRG